MQLIKSVILFFIIFQFCIIDLFSQHNLERKYDIAVYEYDSLLNNAWVGGLYNPQFYPLDIDFDNDDDLIVFDYQGNSVLCFENLFEINGQHTYKFQAIFSNQFPTITNWMHLCDFNCDGLSDLLTYNPIQGSVIQYTGVQDTNNLITFTLQDSLLFTRKNQLENLITFSPFDRPSFEDIDNDGDLDLLFFNASDQVDFHANQSVETYGHCDSFLLEFVTDCWGKFSEDQSSLSFDLDTDCDSLGFVPLLVHTGSSRMLFFDYEDDNDWDLIGGYGNNKNLSFLRNGGNLEEAFMNGLDSLFPMNSSAIDLPNFPAAYFLDIDADDKNELIVSSSFEGKAEENIWLFKNTGTNDNWPVWEWVQHNFLQDQMIDLGAFSKPTIIDYDLNGLDDVLISNRGLASGSNANVYTSYLSLYKNVGTIHAPIFDLVEKDWMGFSSLNLSHIKTTFGDLDADGDEDLIFGDYWGKIFYVENIAMTGSNINFNLNNIIELDLDVGYFATPYLTDIDEDGDLDILSGEAQGRVFYFKNEGNPESFSFILENNFYGQIDVRPDDSALGYSVPYLFRPKSGLSRKLLVGNIEGKVFSYQGIDESLPIFELLDTEIQDINTGAHSSPTVLNKDPEDGGFLISGSIRGGLQLYEFQENLFLNTIPDIQKNNQVQKLNVYPNPITGNQIYLEFPLFPSIQKGTIYFINPLGQIIKSKELNLNPKQQKYSIKLSELNLQHGLNKVLWRSNDGIFFFHANLIK